MPEHSSAALAHRGWGGGGQTLFRGAAWNRRLAWVPIAFVVLFLAARTLSAVLGKLGHPGAALDDAYIHFQYARALAEGHPLRFQPGEPISSGATSVLWPIVLAPFWALGAKGNAILWPAWFFSFCALGALSWEAAQLTQKLAGRAAAAGAAALVLAFGGFLWFAAGGMEVVHEAGFRRSIPPANPRESSLQS